MMDPDLDTLLDELDSELNANTRTSSDKGVRSTLKGYQQSRISSNPVPKGSAKPATGQFEDQLQVDFQDLLNELDTSDDHTAAGSVSAHRQRRSIEPSSSNTSRSIRSTIISLDDSISLATDYPERNASASYTSTRSANTSSKRKYVTKKK